MRARAALVWLLILSFCNAASAECAGRDEPRWMSHHSFVLLLNPMGGEYNVRVGLCVPLFSDDNELLSLNHFEAGASAYLSPVYFVPGGYAQIGPTSFLYFRAELAALTVWSIPMNGAGYYVRPGYDAGWQTDDLPADAGGSAIGWSARFKAVLRGRAEIGSNAELILVSTPWLEINVLDHGDYWVDLRDDLIVANGEWVFAHEAVLLLGTRIPGGPALRFGAFSALRNVPASEYVGHRLGPFFLMSFDRPDPAIEALDFFIRLSVYTHHRFRTGQLATLAGFAVDWDMGGL